MSRLMYDSVTPSAIPTDAQLIAGYIDGPYAWSSVDWARFPHSVTVRIATRWTTRAGHVIDCEAGDATPEQARQWVVQRRADGFADPSVYCNASTWPSVIAAFDAAGVAAPHYWIAHYDGDPTIPSGAVAKQYNDPPGSGGNYDISAVADHWPGVDQGGTVSEINVTDLTPDGLMLLGRVMSMHKNAPTVQATGWGPVQQIPAAAERNGLHDALVSIQAGITAVNSKLDALATAESQTDSDVKASASSVLAAIASGVQVTLTADQAAQIEAQLAKALPGYVVNITPAPAG